MGQEYTSLEIQEARGCHVFARDGRSYIDFLNAQGSVLLGHADPEVDEAVRRTLSSGGPGYPRRDAVQSVRESLLEGFRSEEVAFYHTGTSAVRAAAQAVRKATGRRVIVSCGYHGWDEMWQAPTVPFTVNRHEVCDFYFQPKRLAAFLGEHRAEVAACFLSPDYIHNSPDLIGEIIAICKSHEIPVVADEVKNGFRYGPAASVSHFGYTADAYIVSKGLANGWPLAAVAGPTWLLEPLKFACSTATFHPAAFAAARATLQKILHGGVPAGIAESGGLFVTKARQLLQESRLPIEVPGSGALFQFVVETPELESQFYDLARPNGLCLFRGDNQSPSFAFAGEAIDEALDAFASLLFQLAKARPDTVGQPISPRTRWGAAYAQMDGFPDESMDPAVLLETLGY